MALMCPFCQHKWQPKVPNPLACPKCKRYFTANRLPEVTDEYEPQEKIVTPIIASIPRADSPNPDAYIQCYRGQRFGSCGERAVIKLGKHSYCYEHAVEKLKEIQEEMEIEESDLQ